MAAAFALIASATAAAQAPAYGDWWATGGELYVSPTGTPAGPGTLAQPFRSISDITSTINLNTLTAPLTINVLSGSYTAATGETFPIQLPAHGVSVEAFDLRTGGLPLVDAVNAGAMETILFSTVGNAQLPDSVIRGLDIRNNSAMFNSAELRIDVPSPAQGAERIAIEVRDCEISGQASVAVDLVGQPGINFECMIERNRIFPRNGKEALAGIGVRVLGSTAPTSPVIRSNQINSFPTNVSFLGGGLANQPRLQANFIQVGGVNVRVQDCAPFVVGNTIAFAFAPGGARGLELINVPEMTLAHNLIWNPDHGGMGYDPVDVGPDFSSFQNGDPIRGAWFNMDQDDDVYTNVTLTVGLPNFGPLTGYTAGFVGLDFGAGAALTDLHLAANSQMRELGATNLEVAPGDPLWSASEVPGLPASIWVRRDHAHDVDFDARVSGLFVDIGADECVDLLAVTPPDVSGTRAATLRPRVGTANTNDLDAIGNLHVDGAGNWATEVEVLGTPGDLVLLISGVGFADTIANPAGVGPATLVNKALFENILLTSTIYPGMATAASLSTGFDPSNVVILTGGAIVAGPLNIPFSFGALNPAFLEAEAHLQAVVLTVDANGGTVIQTTNRISLDLNE